MAVLRRLVDDPRLRLTTQALLVVGIAFAALRLRSVWQDSDVRLGRVDAVPLVGAGVLTACGMAGTGLVWIRILRTLGAPTRVWYAAMFFQAQLSKYIPGSIWQYAGRAALARRHGVPFRLAALSLPVEVAASAAAAGALSLLLLGGWGVAAAPALIAAAYALAAALRRRTVRAAVLATAGYAVVWLVIGTGFWLTERAVVGAAAPDVRWSTGAFAAAWVVGFVAVYAPGGIGVRETMIVLLLRGRIGTAEALAVALVSRGLFAVVDLVAGVLGAVVLRRHSPPSSS